MQKNIYGWEMMTRPGQIIYTPLLLQIAFQYQVVVAAPAPPALEEVPPTTGGGEGAVGGQRQEEGQANAGGVQVETAYPPARLHCCLQRRLRVATYKVGQRVAFRAFSSRAFYP